MVTMIIGQDHTTGGTWRLHMHVTMAILTVGMFLRMRWGQYTHTYPVAVDHMLLTLYNHCGHSMASAYCHGDLFNDDITAICRSFCTFPWLWLW